MRNDTIKIDRKHVKMVAHRGMSGLERENTNVAFVAAGNRSYFGIETDIHRTADGKFVVIHDETTKRVSGDAVDVKLRFHKELLNVVIDRFGKDTMLIPDGDEYFNFTVKVAVSPMFLSWVIGFGSKATILYPQSVIDQCKKLCMDAMSHY